MAYIVYEKSSTLIMGPAGRIARPDHRKTYKTMAAAQAAVTRYAKMWWNDIGRFGYEPDDNDPDRDNDPYTVTDPEYILSHF